MTLYPGAIDDGTTLPNPSSTSKTNNPSHASLHDVENDAIKAVETKLGTGSSTPAANTLLRGSGTGTSVWSTLTSSQLAASISDETGSGSAVFATTPTLVTPKVDTINESTLNNGTTIGGVNIKSGALNTNNSVVTANITNNAVTGAKIASYSTNRNNNGSNVAETTAKLETGWVCGQPGVNATITFSVTFPVSFTNVPIVNATFGGDTAGVTSTLGSGGGNVKQAVAEAFGISTSGFSLVVASRDGTNWAANNTVYAHWTAIGA